MADLKPTFSLKVYADYLSMAFHVGIVFREEIIQWSDALIDESDAAEDWMIDISLSANLHPLDLIHLFGQVPGINDYDQSFRLLLGKLARDKPTVEFKDKYLIRQLLESRWWGISQIFKDRIITLEIDLDCFEQGYGDWSHINQDYQNLLSLV